DEEYDCVSHLSAKGTAWRQSGCALTFPRVTRNFPGSFHETFSMSNRFNTPQHAKCTLPHGIGRVIFTPPWICVVPGERSFAALRMTHRRKSLLGSVLKVGREILRCAQDDTSPLAGSFPNPPPERHNPSPAPTGTKGEF